MRNRSNAVPGEGKAEAKESWNTSKTSAREEHERKRRKVSPWLPALSLPGLSLMVPRCLNISWPQGSEHPVPTHFS